MPRLDLVSFHERWSSTAGKHAVQRSLMPAAGSKLLSSLSMAILYGLYSKTYHAARELNLLKVLRPFFFFFFMVLCYAGSRFSSDTDRTPRSRWRSPVCSQRLIWRDWVQLIVEFVAVATILNIMSLPVKEQLCGLECPFLLQVPDQNSLQLCQGNEGPDHWQRTMHSESPTAQCATSLLSDTILWRRSRAHFLLFSRVSNPLFDQVHY